MEWVELDELIENLQRAKGRLREPRPDWPGTWSLVKTIGQSFRGMRYPTREQHQAAWDRFRTLVSEVEEASAAARTRGEERRRNSEGVRDRILLLAERATPPSDFARTVGTVVEVALGGFLIREAVNVLPGPPVDEEKLMLERCSTALKAGFKELSENKGEMLRTDKDAAFTALTEAKEALDAAWARWKAAKQEEYEARQARREEKQRKREDFRERVSERIGRLESREEWLTEHVAKAENHVDELRGKLDDARTDEYRDRVSRWIDEEEARVETWKNQRSDVRAWLEAERDKLR